MPLLPGLQHKQGMVCIGNVRMQATRKRLLILCILPLRQYINTHSMLAIFFKRESRYTMTIDQVPIQKAGVYEGSTIGAALSLAVDTSMLAVLVFCTHTGTTQFVIPSLLRVEPCNDTANRSPVVCVPGPSWHDASPCTSP
eukprot:GHRR01020490.1.p1 GENE.GHRR01020490.1~~GHRR01020490.1.p1  ORF type:complete len:141 (+),score=19.10 GHRR01020490.1:301-723(+)